MVLKLTLLKLKSVNVMVGLVFPLIIYIAVKYFNLKTPMDYVPQHLHKYLEKYSPNSSMVTLRELSETVERLNSERYLLNWQKYGHVESDTVIVVVSVRRDWERLQHLIISLAQVRDVQSLLVIFSHSFYEEKMNHLVRSIDFCLVMQIFFPNSVQLFPDSFPGMDPEDCANMSGRENRCCTERDARVTESKQHWWWTANMVFDQIALSRAHKDMVIFIEEDSFVLPDFLHMFRYAQQSLSYVSDADVLSFGRPLAMELDYDKLTVDTWRPPYDKGLAFNSTTWSKIAPLAIEFCDYNDSSWSYSLLHLFEKFPRGRAVMVACMAPRVISTGVFESGRHALESLWWTTKSDKLFPEIVRAVVLFGHGGKVLKNPKAPANGNGGWSDNRDRLLCFNPLVVSSTEDDSTTTPPIFTPEK